MNTMIRIDDPELDKAEAEFEKLLVDGDEWNENKLFLF